MEIYNQIYLDVLDAHIWTLDYKQTWNIVSINENILKPRLTADYLEIFIAWNILFSSLYSLIANSN